MHKILAEKQELLTEDEIDSTFLMQVGNTCL